VHLAGFKHDAHLRVRPHPSFARAIDVPGPVHAHVGAQHEIARQPDEQVLAARFHPFHRAAADRRVVVDAGETRVDRFEAGDRAAPQRALERSGRTVDTVALRHGSIEP
jgi:hypothetical protein